MPLVILRLYLLHFFIYINSITRKIRELGGIPDMEDMGSFGTSGVALKFKLIPTEIQAARQERVVQRGIQRKLELLYNIFKITDPSIGNYTDVKVEFERNFIMLADDKFKEMTFDFTLVSSGIISKETFLVWHKGMTPEEAQKQIIAARGDMAEDMIGYGD